MDVVNGLIILVDNKNKKLFVVLEEMSKRKNKRDLQKIDLNWSNSKKIND